MLWLQVTHNGYNVKSNVCLFNWHLLLFPVDHDIHNFFCCFQSNVLMPWVCFKPIMLYTKMHHVINFNASRHHSFYNPECSVKKCPKKSWRHTKNCPHMVNFSVSHDWFGTKLVALKNITLKVAKKIVGVAVYWEE